MTFISERSEKFKTNTNLFISCFIKSEQFGWFGLVIALRLQTPKHISGGWSHYTDTSEPVDGGVGILQL
jgi:hypothetical protein